VKSQRALARLPGALEIAPEVVERAVAATEGLLAEVRRRQEEERRIAQEIDDAAGRAAFRPHAVIQTEHRVPTQITICGLIGGPARFLVIPFDLSKSPLTFIQQAVAGLPAKQENGRRYVSFFGEALGIIVNYAPDRAVRCDLEGQPVEVLPKAYRIGEVRLSVGGKAVPANLIHRLLRSTETEETSKPMA
jgi:hypothetical protein